MTRPPAFRPGGPGQGPASGLPATRSERPPFAPGNLVMLTHGARTPRVYGPLAEALAAGLTEDRPDLAAYPEALAAWATAEAQAALLRRHLAEVGTIDPDTGKPRAESLTVLRSFERLAAEHRATLGLDPRSEASLARERAAAATLAVDLDALAQRGRAVLTAREQAGLPAPPDLAGDVLAEVRAAAQADSAAHAAAWLAEHYPDAQDQAQDQEPEVIPGEER
jgi:hypothetical protein